VAERSTAGREVEVRVHAVHVVAQAVDTGEWPATVEILDGVGDLVAAASRWALVAELEAAAA